MTRQRYPETFKIEAVNQITERGRPMADIARAIGVSSHSLSAWLRQYGKPADQLLEESALQAELRQVTEERNILKEAAAYFARCHLLHTHRFSAPCFLTFHSSSPNTFRHVESITTSVMRPLQCCR